MTENNVVSQDEWDNARITIYKILNNFADQNPHIKVQMKTMGEVISENMQREYNKN